MTPNDLINNAVKLKTAGYGLAETLLMLALGLLLLLVASVTVFLYRRLRAFEASARERSQRRDEQLASMEARMQREAVLLVSVQTNLRFLLDLVARCPRTDCPTRCLSVSMQWSGDAPAMVEPAASVVVAASGVPIKS